MNKILETMRGSWITRDREIAETNREYLHSAAVQIPADLRDKLRIVLEWADMIEKSNDVIIDGACKDSDRYLNEIIFLEEQIKVLVQAIRVTKNVDSIQALRTTTRETIERMEKRKCEEELKRL
jgi:hypothetical protein